MDVFSAQNGAPQDADGKCLDLGSRESKIKSRVPKDGSVFDISNSPVLPEMTLKLFQSVEIGDLTLKHRVVLAPLTRNRASKTYVPLLPTVAEYYAQRASTPGTFLISEATYIAPRAGGYPNVPGIWNDEQIAAWKVVNCINITNT